MIMTREKKENIAPAIYPTVVLAIKKNMANKTQATRHKAISIENIILYKISIIAF